MFHVKQVNTALTMRKPQIPIIIGPTASGKTALAVKLAKEINGEIISADSRQVYRGMDIGTGKDLGEYGNIPYHLIDVVDAGEEFSVSDFQSLALPAISTIIERNSTPIICGGTGHYVKALIEDYRFDMDKSDLDFTNQLEKQSREYLYLMLKDLEIWESHHWENDSKRRIARAIEKAAKGKSKRIRLPSFKELYDFRIYYVKIERETVRQRIKTRLISRLEEGMIDEVKELASSGVSHERLERYGLEYKWISYYLRGKITETELIEKLSVEISRYAKRQMTFIRYLQKQGHLLTGVSCYEELIRDFRNWSNR